MSINAYDKGDLVRISGSFVNASDVATDPTEAVLRVKAPDKTTTVCRWPTPGAGESALTRDSAGAFHVDLSITQSGYWTYRWEGTGAVQSADEATLYARVSAF
jgi:hypothetical protein